MMTTMPNLYGKKKKSSLSKAIKQPDFSNKKPMMKINKQAPMLGVPRGKK